MPLNWGGGSYTLIIQRGEGKNNRLCKKIEKESKFKKEEKNRNSIEKTKKFPQFIIIIITDG